MSYPHDDNTAGRHGTGSRRAGGNGSGYYSQKDDSETDHSPDENARLGRDIQVAIQQAGTARPDIELCRSMRTGDPRTGAYEVHTSNNSLQYGR
jgi:hypothetical protein